ncbi:MAG: phosphatidate cytidylyltransferase [Clostridiales bacterium]|nr:phosphatidate cytidylyltransferase [Clostridiales bacterium]
MAKRILVAVVLLPAMLWIMLVPPPLAWTVLVCFISALAAFELLRAVGEGKITPPMKAAAILSAALLPLGSWAELGTACVNLLSFVVMAVCFWCAIRAYDGDSVRVGFFHVLVCLFAGIILPLALSALVELRRMDHGKYLVLLAVLLTFVTDAGAYFAGVFLGKHRGITKVSPNKSVEGYIGGFISGAVFAILYGLAAGKIAGEAVNLLPLGLCGLFGALATEVGDLAFSFIKRQYGVKDYGHLLPGHGGMLDRFDSMMFCGPVVLFIVQCLPVFGGQSI